MEEVVETVTCHCCGLVEECTPEYRQKHQERWICGLCATVIEDDESGLDKAIESHVKFHEEFRSSFSSTPSSSPRRSNFSTEEEEESPAEDSLISAVIKLMRRTLDSPRRNSGTGGRPFDRRMERSKSCFATMGGEREGQ